jgi:hypothetical protein
MGVHQAVVMAMVNRLAGAGFGDNRIGGFWLRQLGETVPMHEAIIIVMEHRRDGRALHGARRKTAIQAIGREIHIGLATHDKTPWRSSLVVSVNYLHWAQMSRAKSAILTKYVRDFSVKFCKM